MTRPVIALAADHAGYELKNSMKAVLEEHGFALLDLGPGQNVAASATACALTP